MGAIEDQSLSKFVDNDLDEREEMAADIDTYIVEPLALLAGLFANLEGEENDYLQGKNVGNLLGLFVRGARAELKIHKKGGYKVKALRDLLAGMGVDLDDIGADKYSATNKAGQETCKAQA